MQHVAFVSEPLRFVKHGFMNNLLFARFVLHFKCRLFVYALIASCFFDLHLLQLDRIIVQQWSCTSTTQAENLLTEQVSTFLFCVPHMTSYF